MLSEEDKSEVQKMINLSVNHICFDVLEPRLKKLEEKVKVLQ